MPQTTNKPLSTPTRIRLRELSEAVPRESLLAEHPKGEIFACDFYVIEAETGLEVTGGYQIERIVNIDHHAPTPRMNRPVSSTNLAIERVSDQGPAGADDAIVINHTDCDSLLSSAIMAGELPPDPVYGEAAIAADHTGAEHAIADLLQSLDHLRDFELSRRSLARHLQGKVLDPVAQVALARRCHRRGKARDAVENGEFQLIGKIAWAEFDHAMDGEFFPDLLPEAIIIVTASPRDYHDGHWNTKLRLGEAAPEGFTLHDLDMAELDPGYGGRWNAGSNRRGGGTVLDPEAYAEQVARRADAVRKTVVQ